VDTMSWGDSNGARIGLPSPGGSGVFGEMLGAFSMVRAKGTGPWPSGRTSAVPNGSDQLERSDRRSVIDLGDILPGFHVGAVPADHDGDVVRLRALSGPDLGGRVTGKAPRRDLSSVWCGELVSPGWPRGCLSVGHGGDAIGCDQTSLSTSSTTRKESVEVTDLSESGSAAALGLTL
jgi:hypothetical protein